MPPVTPVTPVTAPEVVPPVVAPAPEPVLTWSRVLDTGFKSALQGVEFLDSQTGHAFGWMPDGQRTTGVLRVTTDGGDHWTSIVPTGIRTVLSVSFVSPEVGWVGGDSPSNFLAAPSSYLFKTEDGGASWQAVSLPTCSGVFGSYTVSQVQFTDALQGWVSGTCGLMRTSDGGQSWVVVSSQAKPSQFRFVTDQVAWASAGSTSIRRSIDGGVSWQQHEFKTLFPEDEYGGSLTRVLKTAYQGEQHAWVAMARTSSSKDALFRTRDGGTTWQALSLPAYVRVGGLQFVSANRGWLLDALGAIYRTEDGGESWAQVTVAGGPVWSTSGLVVIGDEESVFTISYGNPSTMPEPFAAWSTVWRARLP